MGVKEQLSDFILASEKRHAFLVAEIQLSEQRVIDENDATLKAELEPLKMRMRDVEKEVAKQALSFTWIDRWMLALSSGYIALVTYIFTKHGDKLK